MKKVLDPTTVLTLTVRSRSAGSRGGCPMRPPLPVPQGGHSATHVPHHRLGSGMGQAGGSLKGSTAAPMHPACPPSQAPCKAQSFAEEFKWPLVPGCSQGWERGSKEAHTEGRGGGGNPPLLQVGGLESYKGGTGLHKDSAQGSGRSQPLPDLPKVQQD